MNDRFDDKELQETLIVEIRDGDESETDAETSDRTERSEAEEEPNHTSEQTDSGKKKKKRLTRLGRWILRMVLVVSIAVAGYSGFQLYKGIKDYRDSENSYQNLAQNTEGQTEETVITDQGERHNYTKANFEALAKINPDVVGWLSLEDTVINYPIAQGSDNEYYLHHLFTKEYNNTGCIFMDVDNAKDFSDLNTILYAHHMRNGSMFAELEGYRDQEYYNTHKELVLQTPSGNYLVEPFAGLLTDGYSDYIQIGFQDSDSFLSYVNQMRSQSTFQSDVTITAEDRILTMSTCRYDVDNGRYAVFAKLTKLD